MHPSTGIHQGFLAFLRPVEVCPEEDFPMF
jgi:hypothetical protein